MESRRLRLSFFPPTQEKWKLEPDLQAWDVGKPKANWLGPKGFRGLEARGSERV